MRPLLRVIVFVTAATTPLACAKSDNKPASDTGARQGSTPAAAEATKPDSGLARGQSAPGDSGAIASAARSAIDSIIGPIDTTITLGAWIAAHPADSVDFRELRTGGLTRTCRTARSTYREAGLTIERHAVFYTPDLFAPDKLDWPTDTSHFVERMCKLGGMDIRVSTPDSGPRGAFYRAAQAESIRRSGVVDVEAQENEENYDGPDKRNVLIAHDPVGSPARLRDRQDSIYEDSTQRVAKRRGPERISEIVFSRIDSGLTIAGVPKLTALVQPIVEYLHAAGRHPKHTIALDSAVIRAVWLAHDTASSLPGPRKAAAFLAVDLVFNEYAGEHQGDGPDNNRSPNGPPHAIEREVKDAGLKFMQGPEDGAPESYQRNWLFKAFEADSGGVMGRSAYIQLLAHGWRSHPRCEVTGPFEREMVVDHGESALRFGNPDPLTHYYLGEAYSDDYSGVRRLWFGEDDTWTRSRLKAIEHFRIAAGSVHDAALRRMAVYQAIRLMLEVPNYRFFDCGSGG